MIRRIFTFIFLTLVAGPGIFAQTPATELDGDVKLMIGNDLSRDDHADWTIVAGHHPIYAQTPKQSSERDDMQTRIDPILRKHKVDMYICGHIHNFQHIRRNGIDYVVNTSGSLSRPDVSATDGTVFCDGGPGFSLLTATPKVLTLSLIDRTGNVIHRITHTK